MPRRIAAHRKQAFYFFARRVYNRGKRIRRDRYAQEFWSQALDLGPFDLRLMSLQAVVNLLVFDTISRININLDPSLIKVGNAR